MVIYFEQVSNESISCFVDGKPIKIQVEDLPKQVSDQVVYRNKGTIFEFEIPQGARCHIGGREFTVEDISSCRVNLSAYESDVSVDVFIAVGTNTHLI